jgi:DNA-binding ferritin-like protein (Dps family)
MQRTSDLVKAIHEHWILTGVSVDDADEMADELADHLSAAVDDGKDVEAVVGSDLRAFADEWAAPVADPDTPAEKVRLVLMTAVMFAAATVGATAIFEWSSRVTIEPVETGLAGILGGCIAVVLVGPASSRLSPSGGLRSGVGVVVVGGIAIGMLLTGWVWAAATFEEAWTVTVPSWLAIAAAVITFGVVLFPLIGLWMRLDRTDGWTKKLLKVLDMFT